MIYSNNMKQMAKRIKQLPGNLLVVFPTDAVARQFVLLYGSGLGECNELRCRRRDLTTVSLVSRDDPAWLCRIKDRRFETILWYDKGPVEVSTLDRSTLLGHERRAATGVRGA